MQFNLVTSVVTPAPDLPPLKASGVISTSISNMGTQATFDLWYILQVLMDSEDIAASPVAGAAATLRRAAEPAGPGSRVCAVRPWKSRESSGSSAAQQGLLSMSSKVSVSVAGCR